MEIIKQLSDAERNELLSGFKMHFHYSDISSALNHKNCYFVNVCHYDFGKILINSSAKHHALPLEEFPTIEAVVQEINENPDFLSVTRPYGQLNGVRIKEISDEFVDNHSKPEHFFLIDRDESPIMNKQGLYYVRDGMHHLVAYAFATKMKDEYFPITGYYCSNKAQLPTD